MLDSDASKRKPESEFGDAKKKLKPSSPSQQHVVAAAAELHNGDGAAHAADYSFAVPHHGEGGVAEQSFDEDGAFNEEGEEVLSELEEEEDDDDDDDDEDDSEDDEERGDEDSEDGVEDGEASFQDRKNNGKGKGAVIYEGKGKGKVEEDDDSEVEDTCEDEQEEEEGDLVEDPLQEVDLSNILASRTRRKTLQPVHFDVKGSSSDEDDDYAPT
ncbi:hypothetical protein O6H91_16G017400 [Diphasiastrum complanatum]|uniref:Uncharacterized protein n=1 Tax=Diphasiastrum complanatum TaxID=34168 RepID=A0ACC2BAA6_DIPCM|nr:hypothetical protein O6H91_16G017400 [Diphasiastrum complanatum]